MPIESCLQFEQQIEHIRGILNNRRDRYKLWWNTLTGLTIAVGVGMGIRLISSQAILLEPIKLTQYLFALGLIFFGLFYFFMYLFCALHLIDNLMEVVLSFFYSKDGLFYGEEQVPFLAAMNLIIGPLPRWENWEQWHKRGFYVSGGFTFFELIVFRLAELEPPHFMNIIPRIYVIMSLYAILGVLLFFHVLLIQKLYHEFEKGKDYLQGLITGEVQLSRTRQHASDTP